LIQKPNHNHQDQHILVSIIKIFTPKLVVFYPNALPGYQGYLATRVDQKIDPPLQPSPQQLTIEWTEDTAN